MPFDRRAVRRSAWVGALSAFLALAALAPSASLADGDPGRGDLIRATKVADLPAHLVKRTVRSWEEEGRRLDALTVHGGVEAYRLVALLFAGSGFVTVAPDYLGLDRDGRRVFRRGLGARMERLFDGRHRQAEVIQALPPTPRRLFKSAFLADVAHPTGPLLRGVETSDGACRYAPQAPTRLYAAPTDEQVAYLNTLHCRRDFRARGVDVPVKSLGKHGHFGSEIIAVPEVLRWFKDLRQQG